MTFYIPIIKDYAEVTGACLEDGEPRLVCKCSSGREILLTLDTVQALMKLFSVPF